MILSTLCLLRTEAFFNRLQLQAVFLLLLLFIFFQEKTIGDNFPRYPSIYRVIVKRHTKKKKEQNRVTYFSIHNTYTFKVLIQIR